MGFYEKHVSRFERPQLLISNGASSTRAPRVEMVIERSGYSSLLGCGSRGKHEAKNKGGACCVIHTAASYDPSLARRCNDTFFSLLGSDVEWQRQEQQLGRTSKGSTARPTRAGLVARGGISRNARTRCCRRKVPRSMQAATVPGTAVQGA